MTNYLGFEDEVVIGYIEGQLTAEKVDPKLMQLNLQGFLEKHTTSFMKELWSLLISASANDSGVPSEFIEKKKEELRLKKEEQVAHIPCTRSAPSAPSSPRPPPPPRILRRSCQSHSCVTAPQLR